MMIKKHQPIECNSQLLFEIMTDDLNDQLCTDITFYYNGKKHTFGVYGDNGETKKNIVFYLDDDRYESFEELKYLGVIDGKNFYKSNMVVKVTEHCGCYADSIPKLAALQNKV